jgi:hypothetical protein
VSTPPSTPYAPPASPAGGAPEISYGLATLKWAALLGAGASLLGGAAHVAYSHAILGRFGGDEYVPRILALTAVRW